MEMEPEGMVWGRLGRHLKRGAVHQVDDLPGVLASEVASAQAGGLNPSQGWNMVTQFPHLYPAILLPVSPYTHSPFVHFQLL